MSSDNLSQDRPVTLFARVFPPFLLQNADRGGCLVNPIGLCFSKAASTTFIDIDSIHYALSLLLSLFYWDLCVEHRMLL